MSPSYSAGLLSEYCRFSQERAKSHLPISMQSDGLARCWGVKFGSSLFLEKKNHRRGSFGDFWIEHARAPGYKQCEE